MKKTIGIFAHVDAGKTTFSEQLLFNNGSVRQRGRVDDKNTVMDTDEIEKQRGITVFSGTSYFEYGDNKYYIIDTPGHTDFFPEARRTMPVIDCAVILISASDSVQSHTELIWNRLKKYDVPAVFFINKTDLDGINIDKVLSDMKTMLSENICLYGSDEMAELIADSNDEFMEKYLNGDFDDGDVIKYASKAVKNRGFFPVFTGTALKNEGIDGFMRIFDRLTDFICFDILKPLRAKVYKVVNDKGGNRISFSKIISGTLNVKDKLLTGDCAETVNELRIYKGSRYETVRFAEAGDICAIAGLKNVHPGDIIGEEFIPCSEEDVSVLLTKVTADEKTPVTKLLEAVKTIEDEEPALKVIYNNGTGEIQLATMGAIQLEILKSQLLLRFGIEADFEKCSVLYKETIKKPTLGCGHFEPLKHYAEVHVELRPAERNSGITFKSECPLDVLTKDKQNLIGQYCLEGDHRGILTCSPLTDVEIVLKIGAVHEKHTHGGDLREALMRAVRHGLEYGENILLEPWYEYSISVPTEFLGRLMTDLGTMNASCSSPETVGERTIVKGHIPVAKAFYYFDELILFTKGKAQINALFSGYDICHNSKEVIDKIAYDKDSDRVNSSDSIFCSHGSGYVVPWYEARSKMHKRV